LNRIEGCDLSRSEWEKLIDEWIVGRNAERNRKMLKRRLLDGITYERLAEEFDMSTQNVCSIIYKCQDKVFKHL
jgi:DNA-directed RNA polymerase specialized sigma24 family protein